MSRWGGFKKGKQRYSQNWNDLKSSSSNKLFFENSATTFSYVDAKGIWNLRSTTEFSKNKLTSAIFFASSVSSATTISFPTSTQAGDLGILLDFSTTVSNIVPSGWTLINRSTTTGMDAISSYKVLTSADISSSVSGLSGSTRKTLLIFRPNKEIFQITAKSVNGQATAATPSNQSLSATEILAPAIGIAHYGSTTAIGTISSGALAMTEITNTTNQRSGYVIFNKNQTPQSGIISMSDGGTNCLQSFYLELS